MQLALPLHPLILVGRRVIAGNDENRLLPAESVAFRSAVPQVRRQSGAARTVARQLLGQLGFDSVEIARSPSRAPVWPAGIVGSLAHCCDVAVAAVARKADLVSVGVDIEPDEPVEAEVAARIATASEKNRYSAEIIESRRLFVIKEAVYKAVFPIDETFLDFDDIEVDLERGIARTTDGRLVPFKMTAGSHIVTLAWIAS